MEVTITHTEQRPLLKRTEIQARIFFNGPTPNRREIAGAIADKGSYKKDLLIIEHIYTEYGETAATVHCHLYEDAQSMERLERANLRAKHQKKEEPTDENADEQQPEEQPEEAQPSGD